MTPSLDGLPNGYSAEPVHRTPATRLRETLDSNDGIVTCPGVYDGLTARIALNAGFKCAGTATSRLGMPDLGITTLQDMVANAGMIASLDWTVPLVADADTGYGGSLMTARTVEAYIPAGVAALHVEDQVVNTDAVTCSARNWLTSLPTSVGFEPRSLPRSGCKQPWAMQATLYLSQEQMLLNSLGFEAAIDRLQKAIDAGANVAFLEGLTSVQQGKDACGRLAPTPVLLNMVAGGATPEFTRQKPKRQASRSSCSQR
ncbi:hypothetical protein LTR81_027526 [Elasticomyces elasticus]